MKNLKKRQQKRRRFIIAKELTKKEGLTLIEILISLAIFGILMVLFSTLMSVAIQMRRNVFQQNKSSMALMKDLVLDEDIKSENKTMTFYLKREGTTEEVTLKIKGELKSKEEKDVKYYVFVPNE